MLLRGVVARMCRLIKWDLRDRIIIIICRFSYVDVIFLVGNEALREVLVGVALRICGIKWDLRCCISSLS